jgi:A nuclease family of the HNH/ENDO VII superfamily with conserved AHH
VKRPAGCQARHIVAGNDPPAEFARGVLKRFGIGINEAANGVFLPADKATQVIAGKTVHASLHTNAYYEAANNALKGLTTKQQVIDKLSSIAQALEAGEFP